VPCLDSILYSSTLSALASLPITCTLLQLSLLAYCAYTKIQSTIRLAVLYLPRYTLHSALVCLPLAPPLILAAALLLTILLGT
jgi:hypothetical protein